MDPIFGLPCISESRAMDNARNRNFIADKLLAQKFASLDLARRSASGKLLTSRSVIRDFRESLDLNSSTKSSHPARRGQFERKPTTGSMSLVEFDKIMNEAKDRKHNHQTPNDFHPSSLSAKASNPNSFILKKENTVILHSFDSDSHHIVDLDHYERCLPINRQKHAMRDAWERATTEDIYFKRQRAHTTSHGYDVSHYPARQKWRERTMCGSPTQTSRAMNVRRNSDHAKRTS